MENLREIDLRKLLLTLFPGIDLSARSLASCPFHPDPNPSLSLYHATDGKPRFHCFGCGIGGDAIDLVQETARLNGEDLSFPEAAARLSELSGTPIDIGPFSESYQTRRLHQERLQKVADYFKGCLQSHPAGFRARSWLIERGIPQETWERLPLGAYPTWEEIKAWARGQEIPLDWLKEEKLLVGATRGGEKWTGALTFFYGLSFNEISRIKLRIPREKGPGSMTWLGKKGAEIGFFGLSSYDPREGDGRVLLVEGEFDLLAPWALAIRQKGLIPPIFCRSGGAAKGDRPYKILAGLGVQALYALPDKTLPGLNGPRRPSKAPRQQTSRS